MSERPEHAAAASAAGAAMDAWTVLDDFADDTAMIFSGRPDSFALAEIDTIDHPREYARAALYLMAAAPLLRDAVFYAKHSLDDAISGLHCECEDCEECGLSVEACTAIECSKTCQCSACLHCVIEMAIRGCEEALRAASPPADDDGGER